MDTTSQTRKDAPFFSVIIPLYNKEKNIGSTIDSVLNQTFSDFELIVVDDGSTDRSAEIVSSIPDERIRVITQSNSGVSEARNNGIAHSKADYIVLLDADDEWLPSHLSEMFSLVSDYGKVADVFATNFTRRFSSGEIVQNRDDLQKGIVPNYFKAIRGGGVINSSCVCISKMALLDVHGFNSKYTMGEDLDLWARLARRYKIAYSPTSSSIYNIGTPNNSCERKIDYSKDAAAVALKDVRCDIYDLRYSFVRYLKFIVKRAIGYHPSVRQ